jgi:hypothetical protein
MSLIWEYTKPQEVIVQAKHWEQALAEYRQATGDCRDPFRLKSGELASILKRAQELKRTEELSKEAV